MHITDADPKARSLVVSFEAPGRPCLARWPLGTPPLESWRRPGEDPYAHEYNWTDVRWNWSLRCDIELADRDLALIADSMMDVTEPA